MILHPVVFEPLKSLTSDFPLPAWKAVDPRQRRLTDSYWLVSQPDHARLSGDLAANFVSPLFPRMDEEIVRAVGAHDAGWAIFPQECSLAFPSGPGPLPEPMILPDGKPRAFTEFKANDYLRAWNSSIARAESSAPVGGVLVSRHFCELGRIRLATAGDSEADQAMVRAFLDDEYARQRRLSAEVTYSAAEVDDYLKVLQFCDLLSLYLCCGACEYVEFPCEFSCGHVRLRWEDEGCILEPSPFQPANGARRTVGLEVAARSYPGEPKITRLEFRLQ